MGWIFLRHRRSGIRGGCIVEKITSNAVFSLALLTSLRKNAPADSGFSGTTGECPGSDCTSFESLVRRDYILHAGTGLLTAK
jgi:hypothetical protein